MYMCMFLSLYKEFDIISVIGTQKDTQMFSECCVIKIRSLNLLSSFFLLRSLNLDDLFFENSSYRPIHDHKHIPMADSEFLDRGDNLFLR